MDETLVGGVKRGKHMRGAAGKTVVVGAMQRDGEIITAVVANQRRATLQPFVTANVLPGGQLHTATNCRATAAFTRNAIAT